MDNTSNDKLQSLLLSKLEDQKKSGHRRSLPLPADGPVVPEGVDIAAFKRALEDAQVSKTPQSGKAISTTYDDLLKAASEEEVAEYLLGPEAEMIRAPLAESLRNAPVPVLSAPPPELPTQKPITPPEPELTVYEDSTKEMGLMKDDRVVNETTIQDIVRQSNVLDKFSIDVKEIEVFSPDVSIEDLKKIQKINLENFLKTKNRTKPVICFQSGYKTELSALSNQDIQHLSVSNLDNYNYQQRYYKIIYEHMENTTLGKIPYDTWLRITSLFDIDTLLYGIYCATFPYTNKMNLRCTGEKCGKSFELGVDNESLIATKNNLETLMIKANEIRLEQRKPEELILQSYLSRHKRIVLGESKVIVELKIPSLYHHLEEGLKYTAELQDIDATIFATMFIDKIYLPNVEAIKEKQRAIYFPPISDFSSRMRVINNLSIYDSEELAEEIEKFGTDYKLSYTIKFAQCPKCGHIMNDIPVKLETLLFTAIRLGRNGRFGMNSTGTI